MKRQRKEYTIDDLFRTLHSIRAWIRMASDQLKRDEEIDTEKSEACGFLANGLDPIELSCPWYTHRGRGFTTYKNFAKLQWAFGMFLPGLTKANLQRILRDFRGRSEEMHERENRRRTQMRSQTDNEKRLFIKDPEVNKHRLMLEDFEDALPWGMIPDRARRRGEKIDREKNAHETNVLFDNFEKKLYALFGQDENETGYAGIDSLVRLMKKIYRETKMPVDDTTVPHEWPPYSLGPRLTIQRSADGRAGLGFVIYIGGWRDRKIFYVPMRVLKRVHEGHRIGKVTLESIQVRGMEGEE